MNHGMIYDKNVELLVNYFNSGCKKEQLLGVELEHFVVERGTQRAVPYENGVEIILQRLQPLIGEAIYSTPSRLRDDIPTTVQSEERGYVPMIGISCPDYEITLEPAAQLEISIKPLASIDEIGKIYASFIEVISPILLDMSCELFCAGVPPVSTEGFLPLIPKKRYELMDEYFKTTGTCGINMMRGTAAAQVNIDFESEADFIKKFRVANILSPLFAFMCDTTGKMERTHIWNNVDPARAMVKNALNSENFGFADYAKYIMGLPPIFIYEAVKASGRHSHNTPVGEMEQRSTSDKPVCEIFAGRLLTDEDIEHVTTMAFPDVRLKNRMEIRVADSMPIEKTLDFAALIQRIFYDNAVLDKFYRDLIKIKSHHILEAKAALIKHGENAAVYGKPAAQWRAELDSYRSSSTAK